MVYKGVTLLLGQRPDQGTKEIFNFNANKEQDENGPSNPTLKAFSTLLLLCFRQSGHAIYFLYALANPHKSRAGNSNHCPQPEEKYPKAPKKGKLNSSSGTESSWLVELWNKTRDFALRLFPPHFPFIHLQFHPSSFYPFEQHDQGCSPQ